MAKKEVSVDVCDICGKETNGYYWWLSMNNNNGCIGEYSLDIDVCEYHGKIVDDYFNEDKTRYFTHTRERYNSKSPTDNETLIKELKEYEMDKDGYY